MQDIWNVMWNKGAEQGCEFNFWWKEIEQNSDGELKGVAKLYSEQQGFNKAEQRSVLSKDKLHIIQVTSLLHSNFCSSDFKSLNRVGLTAIL